MSGVNTVDQPDDPDPTPIASGDTTQEAQWAKRNAQKKARQQYGRGQTLLAGGADGVGKPTVLGG